ncbi:protoporphyrinogen/coproporphyrinogen oxidase [Alkalihalobacterium alkalinitrilicum]|uniref:protoporphyrinogen/coproporphyrinogen oxidase n=1 Tax=Alkalihalobacterium alkalinitrilicum TaxID=427920 RepID=UPI0009957F73|nr:NAD(P)-binding protein [Alkalihalobacterium alkalinitrilicum]
MNKKTYVIGAGVTGLTFGKVFGNEVNILEAHDKLGGKALSYKVETNVGRFGFDLGGHWFHHKNAPDTVKLLKGLPLERHKRLAYVYLENQFLDFPIQQSYKNHSNLEQVKRIEKDFKFIEENDNQSFNNYNEMLVKSYGETLYHWFFRDYNIKMLGVRDLSLIDVGRLEKVRNFRVKDGEKDYNSDFLYPKGDIGAKGIPLILSKGLSVTYNNKVNQINPFKKVMEINDKEIPWNKIISTMPLPSLIEILSDVDPEIVQLSNKLKSSRGFIINLGVKRLPFHSNKSWVYIPSLDYSFYRIGFYSNIQPLLAPEGYVSMYVECSPLFFTNKEEALNLVPRVIEELIEIGFLGGKEDIVTSRPIYLEHNYCLPNSRASEKIREYLKSFGIYSIGRYGTWHWSSQHEDMQQAIKLANEIKENLYNGKIIVKS